MSVGNTSIKGVKRDYELHDNCMTLCYKRYRENIDNVAKSNTV